MQWDQLHQLVKVFIDCLEKDEIMTIRIPKSGFLESAGAFIEANEDMFSDVLHRNLDRRESSRRFSQLFAVAAVVAELNACMNQEQS